MTSFVTLAQHTLPHVTRGLIFLFAEAVIARLPPTPRSGPPEKQGRAEVEEGLLGAEERRAALPASHPSQLNPRVAASSPQALLL